MLFRSISSSKSYREATHHLFLWPQNALGSPLIIRTAPRTPNAGSSFVASTMGVGVEEALGEIVEVRVTVAFKTIGTTVGIGTFRFPD